MENAWRIRQYLNYLVHSRTRHGTHSPFVYRFLEEVVYARNERDILKPLDQWRSAIRADKRAIHVTDLGAGSTKLQSEARVIGDMARTSGKRLKYVHLFYRLMQQRSPQSILELGTSLGISTAYLASGARSATVVTLEGCPETAAAAEAYWKKLNLPSIQLEIGPFKQTLAVALNSLGQVDVLFLDGNHRYRPTLDYFEQALPQLHAQSMVIVDDIHWSREMRTAWDHLVQHDRVTAAINLYELGILFLDPSLSKQEFYIRY